MSKPATLTYYVHYRTYEENVKCKTKIHRIEFFTFSSHSTVECLTPNVRHYLSIQLPRQASLLIKKLFPTEPEWALKMLTPGTSLVVKWLRIRLPMQGTRVRALVREDPTCRGATKPVRHNDWACALEPASHSWGRVLQLLKLVRLEPVFRNKRSHRNEKPMHRNKE